METDYTIARIGSEPFKEELECWIDKRCDSTFKPFIEGRYFKQLRNAGISPENVIHVGTSLLSEREIELVTDAIYLNEGAFEYFSVNRTEIKEKIKIKSEAFECTYDAIFPVSEEWLHTDQLTAFVRTGKLIEVTQEKINLLTKCGRRLFDLVMTDYSTAHILGSIVFADLSRILKVGGKLIVTHLANDPISTARFSPKFSKFLEKGPYRNPIDPQKLFLLEKFNCWSDYLKVRKSATTPKEEAIFNIGNASAKDCPIMIMRRVL